MSLAPKARLGPYEILGALGTGGMGEVYRARDTVLRREVAIKVLPEAVRAQPDRLERFEREAQALASLNHPNIAQVYGLERSGGVLAIAMELVEGEDLADRIRRGPVPLADALGIARQVADALDAAHERGIVHRDLKPANVKVRDDGTVKVLDFGLAKALGSDSGAGAQDPANSPTMTSPATELGIILGTAAYMAPEQAAGRAVDKRADIWAFGVVLYEMLTGRALFGGDSVPETLAAVLRADIDLTALPAETPRALRRLIGRCLERQPKRRLRDIADAHIELDAAAEPEHAATARAQSPRPSRGRRLVGVLVGSVVVAAAFALGIAIPRRPPAPPPDVEFEQKTFDPLWITNARFGRDGQTIIFSAAATGNVPELYAVLAGTVTPKPLGQRATHLLSVSANGELAVIVNARRINHRLFAGTLARMTLDSTPRPTDENVRDADFAPDGASMAMIRQAGQQDQLEFPEGRVRYTSAGYLSDVRVSPDGTRVAFFEHPMRFDDRGWVKVLSADGVKALAGEFVGLEGLAWSKDGKHIIFSGAGSGPYQTLIVNVEGAPVAPQFLASPSMTYAQDIAADGRLLLINADVRNSLRALLPGEQAERDLPWLDWPGPGLISRSLKSLTFSDYGQTAGLNYQVVLHDLPSGKVLRLGEGASFGLSPDERWAGAAINATSELVLYSTGTAKSVRLNRGPIEQLTGRSWQAAHWLDDRHVLVCGSEKGRAPRAYRLDLAGSAPEPVTPEGVSDVWIAPDGKTFLGETGPGTYAAGTLGGDRLRRALGLTADDRIVGWEDQRTVIVSAGNLVPARIERVDVTTGSRTFVREFAPADRSGLISVRFTQWLDRGRGYLYQYSREQDALFVRREHAR